MALGRPITAHADVLLDAARSTFAREGYATAHMSAIAAAAGVTKPTLYARVGPKEEIFTRTVAREAERLSEHLLRSYATAAGRPAREAVQLATDALFDYCTEQPDGFLLLFSTALGGPAIDRDTLVLAPVRQGIAELIAAYLPEPTGVPASTLSVVAAVLVEAAVECARSAVIRHDVDLEQARELARAATSSLLLSRNGFWQAAAAQT